MEKDQPISAAGGHDIVVVGASLGGLAALGTLLGSLPADLNAALFIVQHLSPRSDSYLAELLDRKCALPVRQAVDGEGFRAGRVYVAVRNRHLVLEDGLTRLVLGPRENFSRPAIDPLFRSAAVWYGPRVVGIVLSGNLDNGTNGLSDIKRCGGVTVVQDPDDAEYPDMPRSALEAVKVDHVLPLAEIGPLLVRLAAEPPGRRVPIPEDIMREMRILRDYDEVIGDDPEEDVVSDPPARMSCPECGGPLHRLPKGPIPRYRCEIGHSFTGRELLGGKNGNVEEHIWTVLRLLKERVKVLRVLNRKAQEQGRSRLVGEYEKSLARSEEMIDLTRELLRLNEAR